MLLLLTHNQRIELGPDDMVGASFVPGFGPDPTCWKLWIDRYGRLRQEVQDWCPENDYRECLREGTIAVGPAEVEAVLRRAEAEGLRDLPAEYESQVTDEATISVAIRFPDGVKTVCAYGALWAATVEGNVGMTRLVRVWLGIHRRAFDTPAWLRGWLSQPSSPWVAGRRLRRSLFHFSRPSRPLDFLSDLVGGAMAGKSPEGQVVKLLEAFHYP